MLWKDAATLQFVAALKSYGNQQQLVTLPHLPMAGIDAIVMSAGQLWSSCICLLHWIYMVFPKQMHDGRNWPYNLSSARITTQYSIVQRTQYVVQRLDSLTNAAPLKSYGNQHTLLSRHVLS